VYASAGVDLVKLDSPPLLVCDIFDSDKEENGSEEEEEEDDGDLSLSLLLRREAFLGEACGDVSSPVEGSAIADLWEFSSCVFSRLFDLDEFASGGEEALYSCDWGTCSPLLSVISGELCSFSLTPFSVE